jgi:hypothetical protein
VIFMPPLQYEELPHDTDPALLVVGQKHALFPDEMKAIEQMESAFGAMKAPKTRNRELVYTHAVTRIEIPLRAQHPHLYDKILRLMRSVDAQYWSELQQPGLDAMPEIEYIVYDTALAKNPPGIEAHVDNGSAITLIIMLSNQSEYTGGVNSFEPNREIKLEYAQAVLFRGEKCMHWISPVLQGRRAILQVELQKGMPSNIAFCT